MMMKTDNCIYNFALHSYYIPVVERFLLKLKNDSEDSDKYENGETIVSLSLNHTELRLLIERLQRLQQEGAQSV